MNIFVNILLWFSYLTSLYFAVFWLMVLLSDENHNPTDRKKRWKSWPMVSIAVPAYNEEEAIEATLKSLVSLDYPTDKLEIIVVNDGSTDRTEQIVTEFAEKHQNRNIKLISQKNAGKGAALNRALSEAKGQFFVVMDADSFVKPDALKKLLAYFTSPDIATVLPVLKVHEPRNVLQKMQWYEYLINMFYKELMSRLNCVHVAPGPFSVYRAEILRKVGGFDANHNLTEDLEISLRLQSHHYRIVQVLDTEVMTIAPATFKELYRQRNRWYKGSIYNALKYKKLIFNKQYGDFGLMQMPTIILSGMIALIMITSIAYYTFKPYVLYFKNLSYVDFDMWTFIRDFTPRFNLLDLNYTTLAVAFVMLGVSVYIFKKAHHSTKEEIKKHGILPIVAYMFLYFLVLGTMWVGISIDMLRGKKQHW
ncbi:glycosyltransferase family 2 protein [Candidatus Woesearchaeota archaeon]|nr:MAG: glycosyltransferase family 2 protein [Candidatus Woesearchaeota archaeon]